jgi:hypothetical protein
VTDEGKKDTEGFVSSTGMKYGYAYDKGGKLKTFFGVSGIPHAALIDPTGKVVWDGHPAELSPEILNKYLVGALPKPMWEWPASAGPARSALQKGKLADALAASAKIPEADGGSAIKTALEAMIKSRVSAMQADFTAGNFLSAKDSATDLQKALEGLPEKAEADKTLADIKANADAEKIMKAQKAIRDSPRAATGQVQGDGEGLDGSAEDREGPRRHVRREGSERGAEDAAQAQSGQVASSSRREFRAPAPSSTARGAVFSSVGDGDS